MRVLVTGSKGFIGKNLCIRLSELDGFDISTFDRGESLETLQLKIQGTDVVVHLAGVNRPVDPADFFTVNTNLTLAITQAIRDSNRVIPLLLTSSIQAALDNPYGVSKKQSEDAVLKLARDTGCPVAVFRLPNVFGKWCKPNYNSVVATFCYNIANGLPIHVNNSDTMLSLIHIDDVMELLIDTLLHPVEGACWPDIKPVYQITLGALSEIICKFRDDRNALRTERVGIGLTRALYSTYLSYLSTGNFSYLVPSHSDPRGTFVEMLKTSDSGQFSFFTAHPGVTRGGHYHHTKTEKFLVIKGRARFGFKNILTNEYLEYFSDDQIYRIVETIPGWAHDITNIGDDDMVVMLWANEVFDARKPDTISMKVSA